MQSSSVISKHNENSRVRPNSRQRLSELKREEEYLSETFKIDNFYSDNKLDLHSLKSKIDQIRKKGEKDNPEDSNINERHNNSVLVSLSSKIQKMGPPKKTQQKINSGKLTDRTDIESSQRARNTSSISNRHFVKKTNVKQVRQNEQVKLNDRKKHVSDFKTNLGTGNKADGNSRYQSIEHQTDRKNRELQEQDLYGNFRSTIIPKIQTIGRRQSVVSGKSQKSESLRRILNSSRLQPLSSYKKKLIMLKVEKEEELAQFQANVGTIWEIYEKQSEIIKILSFDSTSVLKSKVISQQFLAILLQYKEIVCSTKLQFLVGIIDNCLDYGHAKIIILSRLLQNLSIVYVVLQIIQQTTKSQTRFHSSHLVNFVGISSNNLLLILRLITLVSVINEELTLCPSVVNIFNVISQFQMSSYQQQLNSVKDAVMRIEHNNQLLSIIHNKLNNKLGTKEYHKGCFGAFIKGVLIDRLKEDIQIAGDKTGKAINFRTKPFFQYSYFIFEYLAFHIHHEQYVGLFPKQIETVPQPYLSYKKQFTIILDPSKVLVHSGREKVYIRSHAEIFLLQLSKKCNVIFWSDLMPNQIDPIFDLVDIKNSKYLQKASSLQNEPVQSTQIKRLYKHHCFYDYNSRGQLALIKDTSRIGCPENKYMIFDCDLQNYYGSERDKVIMISWKGEAKDTKLATVLDIILPFLREGTDLSKGLILLKPRLEELLRAKKSNHPNHRREFV